MKKISILGCGWLGLPVAEYLVQHGFEVKGSTTRKEKIPQLKNAGIQPYILKLGQELIGKKWEVFLQSNLLILNIPPGKRDTNVEENHPQQIELLLKELEKNSIQKLIFISSTGVYGNQKELVTEDTPTKPTRGSGKSLVKIEALLQNQDWLKTTILRMGGLVGGDRKAGRFLAGKKDVANGNARVNMVHREDCISIISQIIRQGAWDNVFNVCADKHPTRKEFYTAQAIKENLEPPIFIDKNEDLDKVVSNEKIKRVLGYEFKKPDPMFF